MNFHKIFLIYLNLINVNILKKLNIDYSELNNITPSIGVWDDHDYSINDGDGSFKFKIQAKKLFLYYIDEKEDSPRRNPNRLIYATYYFGDLKSHKNFRLILLDVRYNKTGYIFEKNQDMLGEDQWEWLEKVLTENNETFIFIGSGTQILPFDRLVTESWYYNSRKRLFDLIGKLNKSGVIFLSGDIHSAQILRTFCVLGWNIHEISFKISY